MQLVLRQAGHHPVLLMARRSSCNRPYDLEVAASKNGKGSPTLASASTDASPDHVSPVI